MSLGKLLEEYQASLKRKRSETDEAQLSWLERADRKADEAKAEFLMASLPQAYQEEISRLESDRSSAITRLKADHTSAIKGLEDDHASTIQRLETSHSAAYNRLETRHKLALDKAEKKAASAIAERDRLQRDATMSRRHSRIEKDRDQDRQLHAETRDQWIRSLERQLAEQTAATAKAVKEKLDLEMKSIETIRKLSEDHRDNLAIQLQQLRVRHEYGTAEKRIYVFLSYSLQGVVTDVKRAFSINKRDWEGCTFEFLHEGVWHTDLNKTIEQVGWASGSIVSYRMVKQE